MGKYFITQKREKYIRITIEAKNKKEALEKLDDGDYAAEDILEDEFLLPSSNWETIKVEKAKIEKEPRN